MVKKISTAYLPRLVNLFGFPLCLITSNAITPQNSPYKRAIRLLIIGFASVSYSTWGSELINRTKRGGYQLDIRHVFGVCGIKEVPEPCS